MVAAVLIVQLQELIQTPTMHIPFLILFLS